MSFSRATALLAVILAFTAGCTRNAPAAPNYADTINAYYQAHPSCLWRDANRFPVQAAPDEARSEGYDALVDQGLLTRTVTEKKIILVSRRENNYDISDEGRSAWTADPNQPGFGNFCYGHRKVSSVDGNTPTSGQPGATTTVNYHYTLTGVPDWASAAETQTAFPSLRAVRASQAASATLTNTTQGWQVTSNLRESNATPADGKMVQ